MIGSLNLAKLDVCGYSFLFIFNFKLLIGKFYNLYLCAKIKKTQSSSRRV